MNVDILGGFISLCQLVTDNEQIFGEGRYV